MTKLPVLWCSSLSLLAVMACQPEGAGGTDAPAPEAGGRPTSPPPPPPPAGMSDAEAHQVALALWHDNDRVKHPKGSCSGCHGADFFDLARIGTTAEDTIRRAVNDGATQEQAEALAQAIGAMRAELELPQTDARTFRPFQPGGQVLLPDAEGHPNELRVMRDVAFGRSLEQLLPTWFGTRISSLTMAEQARDEMLDLAQGTNEGGANPDLVQLRDLPVGFESPRWSADLHHGTDEGTFNDWIADMAFEPKPDHVEDWRRVQDAYLDDPTDRNFWLMYVASFSMLEQITAPLCEVNPELTELEARSCGHYRTLNRDKCSVALLGQHMMRTEAMGTENEFMQGALSFAHLDFDRDFDFMYTDRKHGTLLGSGDFWGVGRTARTSVSSSNWPGSLQEQLMTLQFPEFVIESVDPDLDGNTEHHGLRQVWTWIGFTHDPSLQRLGRGATTSGEYSHASYREGNWHIHTNFQQHMRLLTKGFLDAPNVRQRQSRAPLEQGESRFGMDYRFFIDGSVWGGLRWKEDQRWDHQLPLPESLKAEQKELWDQMTSNGFRMSLYLYLDELQTSGQVTSPLPPQSMKSHFGRTAPQHTEADRALVDEVLELHLALGGRTKF